MIADKKPIERRPNTETSPTGCELGRPLGDCALRRAGCGSLYEVLTRLYPPPALFAELGRVPDLDPAIVRWLKNLEAVTPRPEGTRKSMARTCQREEGKYLPNA